MLGYLFNFVGSYFVAYTKIFQWIFVDFNYISFRTFLSNAPFIDSDIDYEELKILESNLQGILIDYKPINSGTISIIFKAKFNNEDVVVKVLRKGIEKKLLSALSFFEFLFFMFGNRDIILNIRTKILEQVNFDTEYENIKLVRDSLKKYSKAETVIPIFKTEKSIVMSYIPGDFIYNLPEEERDFYAEAFVKTNNFLLLKKKIYHLDLHPGNILFIKKDNKFKISYLDMGMIHKLENNDVNLLFDFLCCIYLDQENVYYFFVKNEDRIFENKIPEELKSFLEKNKIFRIKSASIIAKNIYELLAFFSRHKIILKSEIHKLFLGVVSFLGTFALLDKSGKFYEIIKENMKEKLNQ